MTQSTLSTRDLIDRLIGFDTTSRGSNLALIDFVADYLAGLGIESAIIKDPVEAKANLFATIGPDIGGGVILSGHTDVVPVDGQPWSSDPFKVVERDGKLFGRGTSDMKSFSAVALALVPEMLARPLKRPIHLALSYDEEVGCVGVEGIIAYLTQPGRPLPSMCLVGEPTSMEVVNAHKTCGGAVTRVTGLEGHSSDPRKGVNAIEVAAQAIVLLQAYQQQLRQETTNPLFDPPYTTFSVGKIEGGTARNIIPNRCDFVWDFRTLPGVDVPALIKRYQTILDRELVPRLRQVFPRAMVETELQTVVQGLELTADSPAETLAKRLAGANACQTVVYATEAGKFQTAGIPTVVCGPGSIDQAHKADEFIEIAQIQACEVFLRRLIDDLAA